MSRSNVADSEPVEPTLDLAPGRATVEEDAQYRVGRSPSSTLSRTLMSGQMSSSWGTSRIPTRIASAGP